MRPESRRIFIRKFNTRAAAATAAVNRHFRFHPSPGEREKILWMIKGWVGPTNTWVCKLPSKPESMCLMSCHCEWGFWGRGYFNCSTPCFLLWANPAPRWVSCAITVARDPAFMSYNLSPSQHYSGFKGLAKGNFLTTCGVIKLRLIGQPLATSV